MKVKIYFSKSLINDTPYDIFTVFAVHNLNVFQKKKVSTLMRTSDLPMPTIWLKWNIKTLEQ